MYQEYAVSPALGAVVACTWRHTCTPATRARVLPDACVDIVWDGSRLTLAGPDTRPVHHALPANTRLLGLRFVPGAAGTLLGVSASALRDTQVELCELWGPDGDRLEQQLCAAAGDAARLHVMEAAVERRYRQAGPVDPLVRASVRALRPGQARIPTVAQLARTLGVSERQLLRRCDAALGYGPKLLTRVLRLQAFLRALRGHSTLSLAELAASLGYADQAHLAHDVAELAATTPSRLRVEAEVDPARTEQVQG